MQLEAQLARKQAKALRQLLDPQQAALPLSAAAAAALRPLMQLHVGSSTWLLEARLRDELATTATTSSASATSNHKGSDAAGPRAAPAASDAGSTRLGPSALEHQGQRVEPPGGPGGPDGKVAALGDRAVSAERFDLLAELLAGGVRSAVQWRDWRVLAGLLASAWRITLLDAPAGSSAGAQGWLGAHVLKAPIQGTEGHQAHLHPNTGRW